MADRLPPCSTSRSVTPSATLRYFACVLAEGMSLLAGHRYDRNEGGKVVPLG